ncbi:MAG TPA: hypothetical protein VKU00_03000 [Chthonomonadaceae bacterium]|nr:hypothetical protein [Chthonomonadaceae bacterium]
MNQKVNLPIVIVALVVVVALVFGIYTYTTRPIQERNPGAGQIPPSTPDHYREPPPGMHMPGTVKR